jgi:uncharacterized membrane protein YdcZ (DUF606 family)
LIALVVAGETVASLLIDRSTSSASQTATSAPGRIADMLLVLGSVTPVRVS